MSGDDIYRIRWREGWTILKYLYRHPEDTSQIARVIEAWQGRSLPRMLRRMRRRPAGRELLARQPALHQVLSDWDWLRTLPEGSLGRAYLDYCHEVGATQEGMRSYVEEGTSSERTARLPPDERFIQNTLFLSHDLYHIVSGYKTDLVGEICLLAFTAAQLRNTGVFAMMMLGMFSIRLPRLAGQRMMIQAFVRALRAEWFVEQDWVERMSQPLEQIQRQLGVWPPPRYEPLWVGQARRQRIQVVDRRA